MGQRAKVKSYFLTAVGKSFTLSIGDGPEQHLQIGHQNMKLLDKAMIVVICLLQLKLKKSTTVALSQLLLKCNCEIHLREMSRVFTYQVKIRLRRMAILVSHCPLYL